MILDNSLKPQRTQDEMALSLSSSAARREKLNRQLDEYFSRGGPVTKIDAGVTASDGKSPMQPTRIDGSIPQLPARLRLKKYNITDENLAEQMASGKSASEIAKHYGCAKSTIIAKIGKLREKLAARSAA